MCPLCHPYMRHCLKLNMVQCSWVSRLCSMVRFADWKWQQHDAVRDFEIECHKTFSEVLLFRVDLENTAFHKT